MNARFRKILGANAIVLISMVSLTGCIPADLKSLSDEERYSRVNEVLREVDYKNIGFIIKEEKDTGGSALAAAHKTIFYEKGSYKDVSLAILKKVSAEKCSGDEKSNQMHCNFNMTQISVYKNEDDSTLRVLDSSAGR